MSKKRLSAEALEARLKDWNQLNKDLMTWSEEELQEALEHEKASRKRARVLLRLQHRISKLRGIRERRELLEAANG